MKITNPKVQSVDPAVFTRFCGFSYIFDNPGNAFENNGLPVLKSDIDDHNLALFCALAHFVEKFRREFVARFGVCLTEPCSYHVTVMDLIYGGNVQMLRQPERGAFENVFARLPESVISPLPAPFPPLTLQIPEWWKIKFRVRDIAVLAGQTVLVARLEPADQESEHAMALIEQRRRAIDVPLGAIGKPSISEWTPHITLGYFANEELAIAAAQHLEGWCAVSAVATTGCTIEFSSISLYAFTTMNDFWRFLQPAVLLCSREIDAARRNPKAHLGNRGDQKVVISYMYTGAERLGSATWTGRSPNGKRHYEVAAGVEVALFDQRARQARHFHRRATEVYTVLEGEMRIEVAGVEYTLTVGESIIVHPWSAHEVKKDTRFLAQVVTANCSGLNDKHIVD